MLVVLFFVFLEKRRRSMLLRVIPWMLLHSNTIDTDFAISQLG